ncbi:MAG: hypothetical protein ACK520_09455 [Inhella sp.]|uniref:hypothetical protein n=1 Tax=Inhella sp. TaxID=1921806 RepID=UPI003918EDFB
MATQRELSVNPEQSDRRLDAESDAGERSFVWAGNQPEATDHVLTQANVEAYVPDGSIEHHER